MDFHLNRKNGPSLILDGKVWCDVRKFGNALLIHLACVLSPSRTDGVLNGRALSVCMDWHLSVSKATIMPKC